MDLLKNLDNMNVPTAEDFKNHSGFIEETDRLIEFAKLHVTEALKEVSKNISLKESSSNEINNNNIFPFITADDNTVWIINNDSILNAYPLENIK